MKPKDSPNAKNVCDTCSTALAGYDAVHYGSEDTGYQNLCNRCFNALMAKEYGLGDFDNSRIEPIVLADCSGQRHTFHFATRLLGDNMLAITAFELRNGDPAGYEFQVLGDPEQERFVLLGQLVQKMTRALAQTHLKVTPEFGLQIADFAVRGRVGYDPSSDEYMPLLVIDGKEVNWTEFGRMLTSFQGWQFKLEIVDHSGEV